MPDIRQETMRDGFEKFHLLGFPFNAVIHKITVADMNGLIHDHPWGFRTFVIKGGYIEKVYQIDGFNKVHSYNVTHFPGDVFDIKAEHIHEITELLDGECWTLVLPDTNYRNWGFWDFSGNKPKFTPFKNT